MKETAKFLCDSCPERFAAVEELEKHIEAKHQNKLIDKFVVKSLPADEHSASRSPPPPAATTRQQPKAKDGNYACDLCGTSFMKVCKVWIVDLKALY